MVAMESCKIAIPSGHTAMMPGFFLLSDNVSLKNRVYCPRIWLVFSSKITGKD